MTGRPSASKGEFVPTEVKRRAPARLGAFAALALVTFGACRNPIGVASSQRDNVLRVGVGNVALTSPGAGLRQVTALLSQEGLLNFNEDGRPRAWLAEGWTLSPDKL